MTDYPAGTFDLPNAATDNSETPATAFGGTGIGAGMNRFKNNIIALGAKLGFGTSTPSRGTALVGSASGSQWARFSRRNILVNGSGRTKQRATLPTTDNSYGFDRARVLMENANGFTLATSGALGGNTAMAHIVGSGNNGKGGWWQPVLTADMGDVSGGVVSLQAALYISHARLANMRMAVLQWTGTADNGGTTFPDPISAWGADGTNPTLSGSWTFANTPVSLAVPATTWTTFYIENISISASATNLAVMVWCDARTTTAADLFLLSAVQLERGAVCTALEQQHAGEEIRECQEWLYVINASASAGAQFAVGNVNTTTTAYFGLNHPRMRAKPTGSVSAAADFAVQHNAAATACTVLAVTATGTDAQRVDAIVAAGLTAGNGCRLIANSTTAATITLTAEP